MEKNIITIALTSRIHKILEDAKNLMEFYMSENSIVAATDKFANDFTRWYLTKLFAFKFKTVGITFAAAMGHYYIWTSPTSKNLRFITKLFSSVGVQECAIVCVGNHQRHRGERLSVEIAKFFEDHADEWVRGEVISTDEELQEILKEDDESTPKGSGRYPWGKEE